MRDLRETVHRENGDGEVLFLKMRERGRDSKEKEERGRETWERME